MPDFTTLSGAGWAGVAMVAIAAIWGIVSWARSGKSKKEAEYLKALEEYSEALKSEDVEKIVLLRKKVEEAKKALVVIIGAIACTVLASGCFTRIKEIPTGKYVMFPKEGEVVPALPEGESRWILSSAPTGTKLIFGEDLK